jgi:DNA-binding SARP family transcriptional activator
MEFRILGPLEVTDGGRLVVLQGVKQRALLAVLLLHANEVVSSDRLIEELWGAEPPESGVTALQVRVSQLRKALGESAGLLETRTPGYVLHVAPDALDLERFERLAAEAAGAQPERAADLLREALALWRGPPLVEFAYDAFAQAAINRLQELRLAVLEQRIEADLALARHAQLVGEVEALVVEHPLRERLRAQLMLALYRSGRQAEALDVYQSTRRTLVDSLGIEPTPALQELEGAILRQDRELDLARLPATERSLLVVFRDEARFDALLGLAAPLACRPPKELILTRAAGSAEVLTAVAATLQAERGRLIAEGIPARAAAFVSDNPGADLVRLAVEQDVDLVLVDGQGDLLDDPVVETVLTDSPCDVALLVGRGLLAGPVLVPFVGAEHDWTAVELAAWLAGALGERLLFAGPREGAGGRDASRLLASASLAVQRALGVAAEPLLLDSGPEALLAAAGSVCAVVLGLPDRWRQEGLGSVRTALAGGAAAPVLLVRRGLRPGGLAPAASLTRFTWSLKA